MADALVLLAVAVLLALAFRGAVKHFRGESPCCGGNSEPSEKTLSGTVLGTKTLTIAGMHCEHCVKALTDSLNGIDGVSAKVDLASATAKVLYDRPLDEDRLRAAVEAAGFQVTSIV